MARGTQEYFVLFTLLLLSCLPFSILAAPKKPSFVVRREDIPFIKCQVCKKIAQQIYEQVEKKAAQIAPKKVSEFQIIEIAENVCNLKKAEADWILHIDIVKKGDGGRSRQRRLGEISLKVSPRALAEEREDGLF